MVNFSLFFTVVSNKLEKRVHVGEGGCEGDLFQMVIFNLFLI